MIALFGFSVVVAEWVLLFVASAALIACIVVLILDSRSNRR